jgi:Neuraminidase (sialidase)
MKATLVALTFLLALLPAAQGDEPFVKKTDLFLAGDDGYALYRIPGIVVTAKGTLLAYCEARRSASGDWGTIDVMLRRSTDGGATWSPARKAVQVKGPVAKNPVALAQGLAKSGEVTINNPVAIADRKRGVVHFLYCVEYARCYYQRSDDDGETFGDAIELTATFEQFRKEYDWKVLATGPGHGIQLANGRLLVPVWLSTGSGGHAHRPSCVSVIYSDDDGRTWERGDIVAADPEPKNPSETVAVQLSDGRVMLNIRHEAEPHLRAVSVSHDGATDWSDLRFDPQLPDPICMGSIFRYSQQPADDANRILFAKPHTPNDRARVNLTVKLSNDEGRTWPVARSLEPGVSGYCDLAVAADKTIYCFYERGSVDQNHYRTKSLCLARFNLPWLENGSTASTGR